MHFYVSCFITFVVVLTTFSPSEQQNSDFIDDDTFRELQGLFDDMAELRRDSDRKKNVYSDCKDVKNQDYRTSTIYRIKPAGATADYWVWCDLKTQGGGWTYILNRFNGSEFFSRGWNSYKKGFGVFDGGEYWLGLDRIHQLTSAKPHELLVELVDWNTTKSYAKYSHFLIGDETEMYRLKSLGNFSGDAFDSLSSHLSMEFTTSDQDNDESDEENCGQRYAAGWWYHKCFSSLLTGIYHRGPTKNRHQHAIRWNNATSQNPSFKEARMMIRPTDGK